MKLDRAKFANSIKCGKKEINFVSEPGFDIALNETIITVTDKSTKDVVCTSLFNTIHWVPIAGLEEKASDVHGGTRKAQATKPSAS